MPPNPLLSNSAGPPAVAHIAQNIPRRRKAAVIARLIRTLDAEFSLAKLPDELQVRLTEEMTAMRYIDQRRLRGVVDEFTAELERFGLAFPSDMNDAIGVLDGALSAGAASHLRDIAGLQQVSADPWDRIAEVEVSKLAPILEEESIEICAVLLSKLKVGKSAELLGMLPGDRARRITFAFSQTTAVDPDTVHRIGEALVARLATESSEAFDDGPVERVGAILNFAPAATRQEVLDGLEAEDATFAEEVRKAIFTFANVATRIEARDVPKITREVDAAMLLSALAFAQTKEEEGKSAEFILSNMSQRMADQLRDEISELGKVSPKDGEAAMSAVVGSIRELEARAEITLIVEEEDA